MSDENWLNAEMIACPNCAQQLYRVDHSPMLDCHTLYCDACANSVEVGFYDAVYSSIYKTLLAKGSIQYEELLRAVEQRLKPCSCGGHYKHDASRRCHNCLAEVIKNEPSVDLLPGFFGLDIGEREPSDEELKEFHSFEAQHVRQEDIWK